MSSVQSAATEQVLESYNVFKSLEACFFNQLLDSCMYLYSIYIQILYTIKTSDDTHVTVTYQCCVCSCFPVYFWSFAAV